MSRGLIDKLIDKLATNVTGDTSSGGYTKLHDGTLIMWGSTYINNGSWTVDINLPVQLYDLNKATVQLCPLAQGYTWNANYGASTKSKIQVGRAPNNSTQYAYWLVIGRWRQ